MDAMRRDSVAEQDFPTPLEPSLRPRPLFYNEDYRVGQTTPLSEERGPPQHTMVDIIEDIDDMIGQFTRNAPFRDDDYGLQPPPTVLERQNTRSDYSRGSLPTLDEEFYGSSLSSSSDVSNDAVSPPYAFNPEKFILLGMSEYSWHERPRSFPSYDNHFEDSDLQTEQERPSSSLARHYSAPLGPPRLSKRPVIIANAAHQYWLESYDLKFPEEPYSPVSEPISPFTCPELADDSYDCLECLSISTEPPMPTDTRFSRQISDLEGPETNFRSYSEPTNFKPIGNWI